MQIYFAGSISGGRQFQEIYQNIVAHLKQGGHTVPTEHVAFPNVLQVEEGLDAREIYQRDVDWLAASDAMIADVSNPSLGVGYELGFALDQKIPVLAIYQQDVFLSRMITGNPNPLLQVKSYRDWNSCQQEIDLFTSSLA